MVYFSLSGTQETLEALSHFLFIYARNIMKEFFYYFIWYNVKHFIAHLEQAKECAIKLLYLISDEKSYKGKVYSSFSLEFV